MGILSRNNVHFYCVKVIDINGLNTEIQIYDENETVSTPLWVSSGKFCRYPLCQSLIYLLFIIFVIFFCVCFKKNKSLLRVLL